MSCPGVLYISAVHGSHHGHTVLYIFLQGIFKLLKKGCAPCPLYGLAHCPWFILLQCCRSVAHLPDGYFYVVEVRLCTMSIVKSCPWCTLRQWVAAGVPSGLTPLPVLCSSLCCQHFSHHIFRRISVYTCISVKHIHEIGDTVRGSVDLFLDNL